VDRYWKEAKEYVRLRTTDGEEPAWIGLSIDDPRLQDWLAYFRWRLGFLPRGIAYLQSSVINEFLVPDARPQLFDTRYRALTVVK